MKIAMMYPDIRHGGVYVFMKKLSEELEKRGHEITFLGRGFGRLKFWFMCKAENCDVIHLHDFNLPALTSDTPTVSTYHGCMWDVFNKTKDLRAFAGAVMQNLRVAGSDVNVVISKRVQMKIKNSVFIPNAVDTEMFNPDVKPFEIKTDKIKVMWAGRKEYLKGYEDLPKITKEFYLIECYDKPFKDMPGHYASCDVFILPSHYEGFGLCILEAMSSSKPVVAYDVGAISEIVVNGVNGYLVKENDYKDFIDKIKLAYKNRKLLGKKGRKICESTYTWDKVADRYEEAYERAIEVRK